MKTARQATVARGKDEKGPHGRGHPFASPEAREERKDVPEDGGDPACRCGARVGRHELREADRCGSLGDVENGDGQA